MADALITQIVSGILTGGAGAATTLLGAFHSLKARVTALEEAFGKPEPVKTGVHLTIYAIDDTLKRLKRDIDSWEDDPPRWADRLVARARTGSSNDLSTQLQFEERLNQTIRSFNERLSRAQDDLDKFRRQESETVDPDDFLAREEYINDSKVRSEEMVRLREQLATTNGLLKGVMSTMGLIDPDRPKGQRSGR